MTARTTLLAVLVSLVAGSLSSAFGQQYAGQPRQPYPQAAAAQQPVQQRPGYPQGAVRQPVQQPARPMGPVQGPYRVQPGRAVPPGASAVVPQNTPTLQRRAPQTMNSPFQLTPAQQAEVDTVLKKWEEASKTHKRIVIEFDRFETNPAFTGGKDVPIHIVQGEADFTSSGKWMWYVRGELVNGKLVEGQLAERLVCDGKLVHEFNFRGKSVTQYVLGKETKSEDMVKVMLPFLFDAEAEKLKNRYFIRLLRFPNMPKEQVCIDAYPRYLDEARNFSNARMMVDLTKMEPTALMLTKPGRGTGSFRYKFDKVKINPNNPLELLNDPFKVKIPSGWTTQIGP
jgi:hypothetical protein